MAKFVQVTTKLDLSRFTSLNRVIQEDIKTGRNGPIRQGLREASERAKLYYIRRWVQKAAFPKINRAGWPALEHSTLERKRKMGRPPRSIRDTDTLLRSLSVRYAHSSTGKAKALIGLFEKHSHPTWPGSTKGLAVKLQKVGIFVRGKGTKKWILIPVLPQNIQSEIKRILKNAGRRSLYAIRKGSS